jgi:glycosyltransferase involved in cell wall biosynthesis
MKITATIITFNEAANIRAACESVAWADEILVVDSESTDSTCEIAAQCGAKLLTQKWPGFAAQKQFAVEQASHEWIFSLDADERLSEELRRSIESLRNGSDNDLADGYLMARRTYYQDRWIRGGGWYPDRQLRLFRKRSGHWMKRHIHESVKLNPGAHVEILAGDILHYTESDAAYHHKMIGERYAPLAARQMFEEGTRTSTLRVAAAGPLAFVRSLVFKGGFRDGFAGLSIATFAAYHDFLKHLMLWELQNGKERR